MTGLSKSKNDEPLISVIMPAYNCESYIAQAIESILSQTYKNFELLIVDDASTDLTWNIINQYSDSRIKRRKNSNNIGYLKTVNSIFPLCIGEYITFQDADDWSSCDRLLKQLNLLQKNNKTHLCGTYSTKFNSIIRVTFKYPLTNKMLKKELNKGRTSLFCGASMMLTRSLLEVIGGYRCFFDRIGSEDIDWYIRALEITNGENIPEPLYHYRQHQSSITKTNKNSLAAVSTDLAYIFHKQRQQDGYDTLHLNPDLRSDLEEIFKKSNQINTPLANKIATLLDRLANDHKLFTTIFYNILNSNLAIKLNSYIRKRRCKKLNVIIQQSAIEKPLP